MIEIPITTTLKVDAPVIVSLMYENLSQEEYKNKLQTFKEDMQVNIGLATYIVKHIEDYPTTKSVEVVLCLHEQEWPHD